jgi:hypothetical protein
MNFNELWNIFPYTVLGSAGYFYLDNLTNLKHATFKQSICYHINIAISTIFTHFIYQYYKKNISN